jgi:hypothetical protein
VIRSFKRSELQKISRMNPMHREDQCRFPISAGLYAVQQLSTALQELAHKLWFCSYLCGM